MLTFHRCQQSKAAINRQLKQERRFSPVKSLDWCNPKREKRASDWSNKGIQSNETPIPPFGIIAAMSRNRIIGINGKLPWNTIAEDRNYFNTVTRDKILILGRKSFEEDPSSLTHIRKCIVLSRNPHSYDPNFVKVVPSFSDALQLAQRMRKESDALDCWIGGGERVYEQALMHPSAQELHLTIVDTDVRVDNVSGDIARFPPSYRWDHYFKLAKCWDQRDKHSEYTYKFHIYRRLR